ncbi:MAG TPA: beta/gamma crystallin-related protein [Albitalea sp.]|uniref:beta/gamma crystallin-related protein n=1 Tax=Piscinibacter sp. TaxID=1903157 RepID=UPI002ED0C588
MKSRTMALAAAVLATSLGVMTARAAEMTLYQHYNFGGDQLTLRGYAPNLSQYGFNDRASSVVVRSGRWQVCSDSDFKGACVELGPGEYSALDARLTNQVSSAREVGEYAGRTGAYRNYSRGIIKFFDEPGFKGRSFDLQSDVTDFAARRYNDRAASIIVAEGVWLLCTDANYAGNCRTYGPGRYLNLGPGMADRISSARVVRNAGDAPAVMQGGWAAPPRGNEGPSRVILYSEEGLRGASLAIADTQVDLQRAGFNDAAASMVVEGGPWLMCSDGYFRGNCRVYGPGRYDNLRDAGMSRAISSARPGAPEQAGRRWGNNGQGGIQLYANRDFGGETRAFANDIPNLNGSGFNDRAGSMVVNNGEWELCSEAGYAGSCMVVGPGAYADLGGLSDQLSSLRRLR